jgi:hypothetical protein
MAAASRQNKLTPDIREAVVTVLRAGNTRKAAAAYAGVDETTFYRWVDRDATFASAVRKAEADAQVRNVALIQRAAESTWQAAAWWLERRFPEDFALRHTIDANVTLDLPGMLRQAMALRRQSSLEPPEIIEAEGEVHDDLPDMESPNGANGHVQW